MVRNIIRTVSALALTVGLTMSLAGTASAKATRLEEPTHSDVSHPRRVVGLDVDRVNGRRVWHVLFRDGSLYRFTRCKLEDSGDCYWDAGRMGNRRGRSFVDLHGKVRYVPRRVYAYVIDAAR